MNKLGRGWWGIVYFKMILPPTLHSTLEIQPATAFRGKLQLSLVHVTEKRQCRNRSQSFNLEFVKNILNDNRLLVIEGPQCPKVRFLKTLQYTFSGKYGKKRKCPFATSRLDNTCFGMTTNKLQAQRGREWFERPWSTLLSLLQSEFTQPGDFNTQERKSPMQSPKRWKK